MGWPNCSSAADIEAYVLLGGAFVQLRAAHARNTEDCGRDPHTDVCIRRRLDNLGFIIWRVLAHRDGSIEGNWTI